MPDQLTVYNPATGEEIKTIPQQSAKEVEEAIERSHQAFKTWSKTSANERASLLKKWYELIVEHKEELADLITKENGKPYQEAVGEVLYGAGYIEWFAEEAKRVYGRTVHRQLVNELLSHANRSARCCYHALEFPECDDYTQSGACSCRWLYIYHQAGAGYTAVCL